MSASRKLLERDAELAMLERSMQEARAGAGKLVLVCAEAGLGKSALVEKFAQQHLHDSRIAWGACDSFGVTPRTVGPVHEIAGLLASTRNLGGASDELPAHLFKTLLEDLSHATRTSIVFLEDFHWADDTTLDFFHFLARRVQRTNALFIVTYRCDELPLTHPVRLALAEQTGDHVVRMHLAALSPAAVGELAKASGCDPAVLYEITGGNPFFVKETLASPNEWIPRIVRDAVIARLMRCSAAARELIEFVSMSPAGAEGWLLEDMLGLNQAAVDEGVERGLLLRQADAVGFRHELARRAVHSTFATDRARSMHQRVLDALSQHGADIGQLLYHAIRADNAKAILEYAPRAGREASRLGAHREAAAHFGAALVYSTLLPSTQGAELFQRHAWECSLSNQPKESIASATIALCLLREKGDSEAQSGLLNLLSQQHRILGDRASADDCASSSIAMLEACPPGSPLAMAYNARALLAVQRGWSEEALEFGRRAFALARRLADPVAQSHALDVIGCALAGAGDPRGFGHLERSLALALEHGFDDLAGRAYGSLVFHAILARDFPRVERVFAEGAAYCEKRGISVHGAHLRGYYAFFELERGNWTDAERMAADLLQGSDIVGVQRILPLITLALVRIRRGGPGVDELLDEASELALPTGELHFIGKVAAARAERAWYQGRTSCIEHEVICALSHVQGHTAPWIKGELLWWRSRAQRLDLIPGDIAEPFRLMIAGDWRAAAHFWERAGMRYAQALALADGPEKALREALTIADGLDMGPLAEISRKRLRVLGARGIPRGPSGSTRGNPAGLTAKEVQVLRLLVQGCTNAQLARQLHRSTKTVDHHVSAILEKLGVRSRSEAIVAAFELGIAGEYSLNAAIQSSFSSQGPHWLPRAKNRFAPGEERLP